jgi:uncharacterized membrane protein
MRLSTATSSVERHLMKIPAFELPDLPDIPNLRHPHIAHPFDGLSEKAADKITKALGSMSMFWFLVAWQLGWMALATLGIWLFQFDKYPFIFLLFLSNLIQLWALPILGATQNRADEKRSLKADADHEALTYVATKIDTLEGKLDTLLTQQNTPTSEQRQGYLRQPTELFGEPDPTRQAT